MKAISLWQPWASLIAIGAKRFETRGWLTHHRGPLAIHAALRWQGDQQDICNTKCFSHALREFETQWSGRQHKFPRGAIIAVCDLVYCCPTHVPPPECTADDFAFGDWTPGRWAWRLENVRRLIEPVPCKGRQGLFSVLDTLLETPGYCPTLSNILPAQTGQNQKNPLNDNDKST